MNFFHNIEKSVEWAFYILIYAITPIALLFLALYDTKILLIVFGGLIFWSIIIIIITLFIHSIKYFILDKPGRSNAADNQ